MIDAFPFEEWGEEIGRFWTFGDGTTGTYIMTALGIAFMLITFWGFVTLESRKLRAQAELLRAAGGLPPPGGNPPGPGPAGPQTDRDD